MEFCPWCGLLLQIKPGLSNHPVCLTCPICPYRYMLETKIVKEIPIIKKEVEPAINRPEAMESAPKTKATCPMCHNGEAYYSQKQSQSGNDAMNTLYKCCNKDCHHEWRDY